MNLHRVAIPQSLLQPGRASWLMGGAWVLICVMGSYAAMRYDFIPGRLGPRRTSWPTETDYSYSTALIRSPNKTTILAFLHPRCVCTRATVKQLLQTYKAHPGAELVVPVFTPLAVTDRKVWEESEYVQSIRAQIPEAQVIFDRGGVQAWRFGALTSGTILVYDHDGKEIFRGGITDRRGGERDNPGLQQFTRVLSAGPSSTQGKPSPVFGCPLVATTNEATAGSER